MIWSFFAAAAVVAVQPGSALDQDLHCLTAIANTLGVAKTEEDKTSLTAVMFYYLGKVDAAAPDLDLEKAIVAVASLPDFAKKQLPTDLKRCGAEIGSRGQQLSAIGTALTKRGF